MPHVVSKPVPPFSAMGGALVIHQVPAAKDNLIWVLQCTQTGESAVVDGPGLTELDAWSERSGLSPKTILNTHTHGDHVGINRALEKAGRLGAFRVFGPRAAADAVPGITDPVDEGDTVGFGAVTGRVIRTDGHLTGHVCYLFGDVLFSGDTLFTAGCGYLFDGPPEAMFDSLMRLAQLPGDTRVCCAHEYTQDNLRFAWTVEPGNEALTQRIQQVWEVRGEGGCVVPSTLEEERATNPFLRPGSPELVRRVADALPDADLSTPLAVFTATRALKDRRDYKALPDEELPLKPHAPWV